MLFFCQSHDFCPFPAREVIVVLLLTTASNKICRKILKILFFSDFRRRIRHFFDVVLELARPLEAWCFPPGGDFFEAILIAAAAGNRICRKMFFLGFV